MSLIGLLIWLIVLLLVIYVFNLIVNQFQIPPNVKNIIFVVFAIIVLIVLLNKLGLGVHL